MEKLKRKLMEKLPQDIDEVIRAKVNEKLSDFCSKYLLPCFIALAFVSTIGVKAVDAAHDLKELNLQSLSTEPVITTETIYLDDVTSTTKVEGSYIFGCGDVHETKYYEAYVIKEDGGKELMSMPANKIVVYETLSPEDQPYMEIDSSEVFTVETRLYLPAE